MPAVKPAHWGLLLVLLSTRAFGADAPFTPAQAAGEAKRYTVRPKAGETIEFHLRQQRGAVALSVEDGRGHPVSLQIESGRRARMDLSLNGAASREWIVTVAPRRAGATIDYEFAMDPAHATTPADESRAAAFAQYAEAERLRRANIKEGAVPKRDADDIVTARASYESAIAKYTAGSDGCGARRARIGLARLDVGLGNYPAGREQAEAALLEVCTDDPAERAQAAKTSAMASAYLGDFAASVTAHEQALALYRETGDAFYEGIELGNLSEVYSKLGATARALEASKQALSLAEKTGDTQGVVYNRAGTAAIYLARGELAAALEAYRQTLRDLETTPYPMIEGETWNGLGIVHHRMGDFDQSVNAYGKARDIWAATANRVGTAETAMNVGDAILDGHIGTPQRARQSFESALEIARADGLKSQEVRALRGLGACAIADREWDTAREQLTASRELAETIGEVAAQSYAWRALGDVDARTGQLSDARLKYQRAIQLATEAGDQGGEAATLDTLARALADAGELRDAQDVIGRALAIVERQRVEIEDPSLRTSYFGTLRSYYDTQVEVLMRLHHQSPSDGYGFAALVAAERARARTLQDGLAERSIRIERGIDRALAAEEIDAQEQLRMAALKLARLPRETPATLRATSRREVDAASRRLDEVRGRIRATNPKYAQLADPQPLSPAELQKDWLDADTVALEFWLGENSSALWVVTTSSVRAIRLPAARKLEPLIEGLRARLVNPPAAKAGESVNTLAARATEARKETLAAAAQLRAALFGSALDGISAGDFVVVADGGLHRIPLALMIQLPVIAEGSTATTAPARDVTALPSLVTLRWLRSKTPSERQSPSLAIFADPVFRADDVRIANRNDPSSVEAPGPAPAVARSARDFDLTSLARLTQSRNEARSVAGLMQASHTWLALDFDAARASVLAADWHRYSMVHFAAHALVDLRQPELSGIVLSLYDSQGRPVDGFLRMNDIYNLDMPAQLVVLSACESAVGRNVAAEGVFSLSRAFFYAGTPRVLASLWPVDDRATAAFMIEFYRSLLNDHRTPAAALRIAQTRLANQPRWQAPYYWAGFVLQGDWH